MRSSVQDGSPAACSTQPTTAPFLQGARCDECPLSDQKPVPPEIRPDTILVIGEAPGSEEVKQGAPFVGASGHEFLRVLRLHGKCRDDVSLTNAQLCRVPARSMDQYLRRLSKKNKQRKADGQALIKSPLECCKPRLLREIEGASALLILGKTALTVLGAERGEEGLNRIRGFPFELLGKQTVATHHPAFILRSRRHTETLQSDIGKAFRMSAGKLRWTEPEMILDPTLSQLDGALERLERSLVAVDTETGLGSPEKVPLYCVGLGSKDFGICLGFKSKETPPRPFRCPIPLARERLANFFRHAKLCGHNVNVFDRPVLARHGMPLPDYSKTYDTVIAHHITESEMPHDLDFLSSRYTDAPKHKPVDHEHWDDDIELHRYCITDCVVTAMLAPGFAQSLVDTGQIDVYRSDVRLQELCVGMHRVGMKIDESERSRHRKRLQITARAMESKAIEILGRPINLASPEQVRELLFDEWGLPWTEEHETASGEASTNRDAVYELMRQALPAQAQLFLQSLLDYRQAARSLSKDVEGLEPDLLGRVHPHWHGHSVVTGRLSCSDPQVQNVPDTRTDPDSLRSMYVAAPGNVLVGCDLEQVELRLVALVINDQEWLDAFERGEDVHVLNAKCYFPHEQEITKSLRGFAKNLTYMYLYGGEVEMACTQMRRVKDAKSGRRPYAKMRLEEARDARLALLARHPLEAWWKSSLQDFARNKCRKTLVLGRKRFFRDVRSASGSEGLNEIANFVIQGTVGDLMGGAGAAGKVMDRIPFEGKYGPGIIQHGHDSLVVEVKKQYADFTKQVLEESMTTRIEYEGRSIAIPTKIKVGERWSKV